MIMADIKFDGLGVALVTPFKKDFSIDFEALEKLIEHVISGGCDYIVALGTTAETPTLSDQEKNQLSNFILKKVNYRIPLVIGIGGNNTMGVVREINSRNLNGYSAILSVTPYYNKPSQEGLIEHYKTINKVSPLPIILYNVPGRTGVNLSARSTLKLAELSQNFCGIKEASGKIDQCQEIITKAPSNFRLISGDDALIFSLMNIGAKGVISVLANAFPHEVKNLVSLCKESRIKDGENCQKLMLPLIGHLFEEGNPGGIKALLSQMGFMENILRLPLVSVSNTVKDNLAKEASVFFSKND